MKQKYFIISYFSLIFIFAVHAIPKSHLRVLEEVSAIRDSALPPGIISKKEVKLSIDPISREVLVKTNFAPPPMNVTEHVYLVDIQDLLRLEDYLRNLRQHFIVKVFGDLEIKPGQNTLDKAYLLYKNLKEIYLNYKAEESILNEKVRYLKRITEFALNYIQDATNEQLSKIIVERDVDIDSYNKFILLQLVQKLDEDMSEFHHAFIETLPSIFSEYDKTNHVSNLSTYQVVNKDIELSFKLTIFEKEELDIRFKRMIAICNKIVDNQDYHHIARRFDKRIEFSGSFLIQISSIAVLMCFAF